MTAQQADGAGSAAALGARRSRHWGRIVAAMVWAAVSGLGHVAAVVGVWGLLAEWPAPTWVLVTVAAVGFVVSGMLLSVVVLMSMVGALRIRHDLREQLLAHLGGLPLGWFTARSAGRVKQAVRDDVDLLQSVFGETYVLIVRWLTVAVGAVAVFLVADPLFAIVAPVPAVVSLIATPRSKTQSSALAAASAQKAEGEAGVNARSVEFIQGAEVWRVYPGSGSGADRLAAALVEHERAASAQEAATARDARVLAVLGHPLTGVAWVAVVGAGFVGVGWLAPISLVPFLLLAAEFATAVIGVVANRAEFGRVRMVARDYEAVLAEKPLDSGRGVDLAGETAGEAPAVELAGVTFGYRPGHPVVSDVTVRAEYGQTIALVGASGAGKSTIARLIPRFWDVDAGAVRIFGDDVRDLTAAELYRRVTFVFQDVQLLHRTVRENIRLGDPGASEERVVAAARAAHVHDRILALPRGYDSIVGDDAVFSGGEAQRMSIARALLLDAPVIVLDEATAHADAESEAAIHDAIRALTAGRTTLVIAHRLSTIQHAHRIVVLEGGRVVEQGTFAELTDPSISSGTGGARTGNGGVFARLWRLQQHSAVTGGNF